MILTTPFSLKNRYICYYFFTNAIFYVPILLVHFQSSNITSSQAIYLVSIYSIVVAISEVPSGIIADFLGLRASLLVGLGFGAMGAVLLAMGSTFWIFALGQSAVALSMSMSSGTGSAYLYELCEDTGANYEELQGLASSRRYLALGSAGLVGSYLFLTHQTIPFWLTFFSILVGFTFLLTLPPEKRTQSPQKDFAWGRAVWVFMKPLVLDWQLTILTMYIATFFAVTGLVYWLSQPYMLAADISPGWFGTVYAMFFLFSSLGSQVSAPINKKTGYTVSVISLSGLLGAFIIVMGMTGSIWSLLILIGIQFLNGYAVPTLLFLLQKRAPSEKRATVLSIRAMFQRAWLAGFLAVFGWGVEIKGLSYVLIVLGIVVAGVLPILGMLIFKCVVGIRNESHC